MKIIMSGLAILSIFTLVTGCTKEPLNHLTEDESRIYITNHDSTVNFSSYHTFTIADSVAIINNNQSGGKDLNSFDAQFISALKAAMTAQGYTFVDKGSDPDLGVAVSRISNEYTGIISYDDYGGGYYDYWDPFYWGYPGYSYYFPSYYGVYNIREGALSVDIFDLKDASSNHQLKNVWTALIRGSGIFNQGNIDNHVNTLMAQSPYLKVK